MLFFSTVKVMQSSPVELTVIVPAARDQTVILFIAVPIVLFLGLASLGNRRKATAIFFAVIGLGALLTGISAWIYQGRITLSLATQSLTIKESSLFRHTAVSYPLSSVKSAYVDTGVEANKRLAFLLTNGQTIGLDGYVSREGYENAEFEINKFLQANRERKAPIGLR